MSKPVIRPASPGEAPAASNGTLKEIGKALGVTPNLYLTAAHSAAALQSLWGQVGAAKRMRLPVRLREMIALRVAQCNGCSYSLSAHTAQAEDVGIDAEQARAYRKGISSDEKEQALLDLVSRIVEHRGHHSGFEVETARRKGYGDAEIVEVVALVGLYTFKNYLDCVADTKIDYPPADGLAPSPSKRRAPP